jgi:glycosyltransferase involved in cell wall biosynthesis
MKNIRAFSNTGFSLPDNAVIVSLSPFPVDGEWGGAIRSREISKAISEVFPSSYVVNCNNFHFAWLPMPDFMKEDHPQLDDIRMLFKDMGIEGFLHGVPDAIIFDHPWMWTEVKKLKKRYPEVKIIHSSHNIEFRLKEDLLNGLSEDVIDKVIRFLEDTEIEIAQQSDLVVCVTERDAEWFRKMGAENVVAVNNGTNVKTSDISSSLSYALVVGSGHPPNIEGAIKYLKDAVEWLPEDTSLVIAGSMGFSLKGNLGEEHNESRNTHIVRTGIISDEELNRLVCSANVIVLPIPYGGGSNLKTAEALVSGRPIVATTTSFRGFEEFAKSELVRITDDKRFFRDLIDTGCRYKLPSVKREGVERLTWSGTTQKLKDYLRSISGTSS